MIRPRRGGLLDRLGAWLIVTWKLRDVPRHPRYRPWGGHNQWRHR